MSDRRKFMMVSPCHALQGLIASSIMNVMKTVKDFLDWRVRYGSKGYGDSGARTSARTCDHPGCQLQGEHRAPQSRDKLDAYYWFCLDHVRAYNSRWDYYAGMSTQQIEAEVRRDTTWQRPTWKLGTNGGSPQAGYKFRDAFGILDDDDDLSGSAAAHPRRPYPEAKAMQTLGVSDPLTMAGLKVRYKELVKQYHPDANGGDREAEEHFKTINSAYTLLLATFDTTD